MFCILKYYATCSLMTGLAMHPCNPNTREAEGSLGYTARQTTLMTSTPDQFIAAKETQ